MKTLLAALFLATLCAVTGYGQTIKTLGFNTTNGQVVYSGTNVLSFTNLINIQGGLGENGVLIWDSANNEFYAGATFHGEIAFGGTNAAAFAATTRTNLSLGATWLTNTNVTDFRTAIGLGATNDVEFNKGTFNSIVEILEGTNVAVELNPDSPSQFKEGISIFSPNGLAFDGTNAATAAAATRTNLGIPLPALTNTNNFDTLKALEIIDDADPLASGLAVDRALVIWDNANDDWGFLATDNEWRTRADFGDTNAPTNTTNAALYINVIVGTNAYKLPLFQ
jgi:hypothetical protein